MPWFAYAFICAVLLSASALIEKRVLSKVHAIDYSAALAITNLVISIPFLFIIDFSKVTPLLLFIIFVASIFGAMAFYLVAKGTRHLEISTVSPLLALSPGTTSLLAFLVLGEALDAQHITGIILMVIGSYVLSMNPDKGLAEPFRFFVRSRYVHFVLLSLILYSCGAILDRAIVHVFQVPIPVYIFFAHLFISVLYAPIGFVFGGSVSGIVKTFRVAGPYVIVASIFTVGYRFFQMEALRLASVGLVSAIKRSSNFLTTLVGGELFHEKNLTRKAIASLIIILGTFLIVL